MRLYRLSATSNTEFRKTHKLITDHLDVTRVNAVYGRVSVRGIALHDIGRTRTRTKS